MKKIALLTLSLLPGLILADDFSAYDFSVRFPTSLSHFSPFGEVAGKAGTGAASIWGTSPNPACISWGFQDNPCTHEKYKHADYALSGQYTNMRFDEGQEIRFITQALILDLGEAGVFRFGLANANSNEEVIRGFPVTFNFDLIGGRIDWGYQINPQVRIGLGGGYSQSETTFAAPFFDAIHTDRETWSLRAGIAASLAEDSRWMVGLMADYGQGRNHSKTLLPDGAGNLTAGRETETVDQFMLRPGIAWAVTEDKTSWVNLDYEWTRFAIPAETLNNHRIMLGADYLVMDTFHVRAGTFTDLRGNLGWSAAIGVHIPGGVHIDLAYQNNAFPEVSKEFGSAQTFNVSVALVW